MDTSYVPGSDWSKTEDGNVRTWTNRDGTKSTIYDRTGGGRVAKINHETGHVETSSGDSGIK